MKHSNVWIVTLFLAAGAILGLTGGAGVATATPLVLDYTGFTWNSGERNPANIWAVGVFDGFSQPVNDPSEVYTFYLSELQFASVDNPNSVRRTYTYSGGDFAIYRSTGPQNRPYDYGVNPANPSCPSTFTDGTLWLHGLLNDFSLYVDDGLQLGSITASGTYIDGEIFNLLGPDTFFNFAGLTARPGNGIPPGYTYRMDGQTVGTMSPPVPEASALSLLVFALAGSGLFALIRRR